jgi:hypothetical protein
VPHESEECQGAVELSAGAAAGRGAEASRKDSRSGHELQTSVEVVFRSAACCSHPSTCLPLPFPSGDIQSFDSTTSSSLKSTADFRSQAQMDLARAEQLERQAEEVRREEWKKQRQASAIKGKRIILEQQAELEAQLAEARKRYLEVRTAGAAGLKSVDDARASLALVNAQFDKYALALESRLRVNDRSSQQSAHLQAYVVQCESALKQAKRQAKETKVVVERSRAQAAAMRVVEFELTGRNISLVYGSTLVGDSVSNLFLKFFRCMSPAPDPEDKAPEVVWCPEPCTVTELCSPGPGRSVEEVKNPAWRTVRIDLWKLCEAEYDRSVSESRSNEVPLPLCPCRTDADTRLSWCALSFCFRSLPSRYFKIEVWDCDASIKQVASVVQSAIDQAKAASEARTRQALQEAQQAAGQISPPPTQLNPDGTPIAAPLVEAPATVSSVTLPSTRAIRYSYIGQSVVTLQQLLNAQKRKLEQQQASAAVSAPSPGILTLPVINAQLWSARTASRPYENSGTINFVTVAVKDAEA